MAKEFSILDFEELLIEAMNRKKKKEEKEIIDIITEYSKVSTSVTSRKVNSFLRNINPSLLKLKLKNGVDELWKRQKGLIGSFGELILESRKMADISLSKVAQLAHLSKNDINEFELNYPLLLDMDRENIPKLIRILGVYGIKIYRLAEIIKSEENHLRLSYRTQFSSGGLKGVKKSIKNKQAKYVRPSIPEFFSKVREEMEKEDFEELLS